MDADDWKAKQGKIKETMMVDGRIVCFSCSLPLKIRKYKCCLTNVMM